MMRLRRGNYAILFVLTAAVMMSYLAFSIDGGRMKLAYIQAENAAEAASLAAMSVMRDGGAKHDAVTAANAAAQEVRLQRIEHAGSGDDYRVSTKFGKWDWQEQGTGQDFSFRWSEGGSANERQAVTVNVEVLKGGVASIFGPAVGILARGDTWNPSTRSEEPYDKAKWEHFQVQVGARAAFRHRDTFVLVDISRANEVNLPYIRTALANFVDTMRSYDVPGDRLALMMYAGDTWVQELATGDPTGLLDPSTPMADQYVGTLQPGQPFYALATNATTAHESMLNIEPCYVGHDSWFYWYRHMNAIEDGEISAYYPDFQSSFEYWVVGGAPGSTTSNIYDHFRLDPSNANNAFMFQFMDLFALQRVPSCHDEQLAGQPCTYFEDLAASGSALDRAEQCTSWLASETVFTVWDPRRYYSTVASGYRSPIACHTGNYFADYRPNSGEFTGARVIKGINCAYPGDTGYANGDPRYGIEGTDYSPDPAYTMAGSWPGKALDRARNFFSSRANDSAEPNIILITASPPSCGPLIGTTWGPDCESIVDSQATSALQQIQNGNEINLYTVVVGTAGNPAHQALVDYHTHRGWTAVVAKENLDSSLGAIARDMKIQVVQ